MTTKNTYILIITVTETYDGNDLVRTDTNVKPNQLADGNFPTKEFALEMLDHAKEALINDFQPNESIS